MSSQPPAMRPPASARRSWPLPLRLVRARPRLFICAAVGLALGFVLPWDWRLVTRLLVAWNVGTWLYVGLVWRMMARATHQNIRQRALVQDEGQWTILILAIIAAVASLGAVMLQLGAVKEMAGLVKALHILLVALTIVGSFTFIHIMFTMHYAHEYYAEWGIEANRSAGERGGLSFPGTIDPHYIDFAYFSFVIGVASQTADVATTSRDMRSIVLIHGILSFFFNTTVLALTINIAAGLI